MKGDNFMKNNMADQNMMMWMIFQNLHHDSQNYTPTDLEPTNFAQDLLNGFLNHDLFKETVSAYATNIGRNDIVKEINNHKAITSERDGMTNGLVMAVDRGDTDMLANLVDTPETNILSIDALNNFWNADSFISQNNPDLHTHIQASPQYLNYFNQYVAANEMSGKAIETLKHDVHAKHEAANKTLETMEYDGTQMALNGSAKGLFTTLESGHIDTLGYGQAEQTIFTGLAVAEPLTLAALDTTDTALPSDQFQARKNYFADHKPVLGEVHPPAIIDNIDKTPALPSEKGFLVEAYEHIKGTVLTSKAQAGTLKHEELSPEAGVAIVNNSIPSSLRNTFSDMSGADYVVAKLAVEVNDVETQKTYEVQGGDSLWKIAKDEYGLTDYKDIMRAVDHIANNNNLENGVDANHIDVGQKLKMPTAAEVAQPVGAPGKPLDWKALDEDTTLKSNTATLG